MERTRHTREQIIHKVKWGEDLIAQAKTVADACRTDEVAQPNSHSCHQL